MPERVYAPEGSVLAAMVVPTTTTSASDIGLPVEASVTFPVTVVLVAVGTGIRSAYLLSTHT